jgi:hypothetical protein
LIHRDIEDANACNRINDKDGILIAFYNLGNFFDGVFAPVEVSLA